MIDADDRLTERQIDLGRPDAPATMRAIVQISLDLLSIDDALSLADSAMQCGVDWLEVGTPLIISHGMAAVHELRAAFPRTPIVAPPVNSPDYSLSRKLHAPKISVRSLAGV